MTTVVVLQSNYIPWKGYFHLIQAADRMIFHDDLQFTHSDWRNRNRIITPDGPRWLTIPTGRDEKRLICDVEVHDQGWKGSHRRMLEQNYRRAAYFDENVELLDFVYDNTITNLSEFNQRAITYLARRLGIATEFFDSRRWSSSGKKTEKLVDLLRQAGAEVYLSGPAGRNYLDAALFEQAGIELRYFAYPGYPQYPQLYGFQESKVSVLDLVFNVGKERAAEWIWNSDR